MSHLRTMGYSGESRNVRTAGAVRCTGPGSASWLYGFFRRTARMNCPLRQTRGIHRAQRSYFLDFSSIFLTLNVSNCQNRTVRTVILSSINKNFLKLKYCHKYHRGFTPLYATLHCIHIFRNTGEITMQAKRHRKDHISVGI